MLPAVSIEYLSAAVLSSASGFGGGGVTTGKDGCFGFLGHRRLYRCSEECILGFLKTYTYFDTVIADPPVTFMAKAKFVLVCTPGQMEVSTEDVACNPVGRSTILLNDGALKLMELPLG